MQRNWKRGAHAAFFAATLCLPFAVEASETFALSQLARPSGVFEGEVNEIIFNPTEAMIRSIADPWGSASSFGLAGYGALKASTTATASAEMFGRFKGRSGVGFSDGLTFLSTGLSGQAGFFTVTLQFDRSLSGEGGLLNSVAADSLHLGANFFAYDYQEVLQCLPSGSPTCGLALTKTTVNGANSATWLSDNIVSVIVPIIFGQANDISLSLDLSVLATYEQGAATWTADAAHSLYWGGISSVTDANGNSVGFGLTSTSGTDYLRSFAPTTTAVPEPQTFLLAPLGLGILGIRMRRGLRSMHCVEGRCTGPN